jgi:hypothetical protein
MKVGDYVRALTFGGKVKIARIKEIEDGYIYLDNKFVVHDVIKSSPNIIDLIEVGDYINGMKVIDNSSPHYRLVLENIDYNVKKGLRNFYINKESQIKNIVTKEEFERMQYKVGE